MITPRRRVALSLGSEYVPGLDAVLAGAVLAADNLGWEILGIRDGYDGLLHPERYPHGGLVPLQREWVETLGRSGGAMLGTAARSDPFRARTLTADRTPTEVDRSDDLLAALAAQQIDGVIAIAGALDLAVLLKLQRKGLKTVAIPRSTENDVAATQLAFGFNSALSFATDLLDRTRIAAHARRCIEVVEVPGQHAGWLALQSGIAAGADAVLIPELPYQPDQIAQRLQAGLAGRGSGLVVVAAGARPAGPQLDGFTDELKASLAPNAVGGSSTQVIESSGRVAEQVALQLQRLTDVECRPLVLGPLATSGAPTAVDRQLGIGYGAAAVRGLHDGRVGTMVAFEPPEMRFVPLGDAVNRVRTVPTGNLFLHIARSLGIAV